MDIKETVTPEEVARHYSAALDSVALINNGQPTDMADEDWADCLARNVEHLKIMVAKDFMKDQDLAPLKAAITKGSK
jgi:hypothetical protein